MVNKSIKVTAFPTSCTGWVKAGPGKAALKSAFGTAVAMGVLGAGQAQAIVMVEVEGQQWEVTTFTGSYNDNRDKFNTPGDEGGVMPWWGSRQKANRFAQKVGGSLGLPNEFAQFVDRPRFGPFFAYEVFPLLDSQIELAAIDPQNINGTGLLNPAVDPIQSYTWAQAEEVPGPLPILGLGAVFGFSRKLRKRIKASTNAVSSTYSL